MKTHIEETANSEFVGWLEDDNGNKVPRTTVTAGNKIAVGSKLGKIKKALESQLIVPVSPEGEEAIDSLEEDTDEDYIGQPAKKPKPKKDENVSFYYASANAEEVKEDNTRRVQSVIKRAKEVREINGVTCHIVEGNWSSNFKFTHGAIHYSFEVIAHGDAFEVVISDGYQISLGVSYFDQHIPKFCDWFKSLTTLAPVGDTIHGSRKKYPNHMLIWSGGNYKILAVKSL